MKEFQPPPASAQPLPVADIVANKPTEQLEYESFPVRKPEEDLNDFKVQVRASTLARCRTKLKKISSASFPLHEVMLAIGTTALGVYLGAIQTEVMTGCCKSIFYNTIIPVVAASSIIIYLFLRRAAGNDPAQVALDILEELPDPERTR